MRLNIPRHIVATSLVVVVARVVGLAFQVSPAQAADGIGAQVDNEECLACHGSPGIQVTFDNGDVVDNFAVQATGKLLIQEAGKYTFGFVSDEGGDLRINGELVA